MPSDPVRIVTHGPATPIRIVERGGDPVRIVLSGPSEPIRVVTHDVSDPVRITSGRGLLYSPILELEADTGVITTAGFVDEWRDQSGNGYNFTATGTSRPVLTTYGGYPCLKFDGINDWMLGQNWSAFDNMENFTVFVVVNGTALNGNGFYITKVDSTPPAKYIGWEIYPSVNVGVGIGGMAINTNVPVGIMEVDNRSSTPLSSAVLTFEQISFSEMHAYINGDNSGEFYSPTGTINNSSNSQPVRIGTEGCITNPFFFLEENICSIRVYSPAPSATIRAEIESELASRYGI